MFEWLEMKKYLKFNQHNQFVLKLTAVFRFNFDFKKKIITYCAVCQIETYSVFSISFGIFDMRGMFSYCSNHAKVTVIMHFFFFTFVTYYI